MRLGLISDTHLQNWQAFGQCHEDRISKRLLKQRDNFLQAVDVFKKERVDCIVHGGDWVHSVGSVSNEVLNISSEILKNLAIPILLVCGNHDTPVRVSPKDHHIITNILNNLRAKAPDMEYLSDKVYLVNYQDEVEYDKITGYELVVLHKTPVGSRLGSFTFNDGVNWRKLATHNRFVAFGHIHQMQKLSENCFIMGSPMQLGFGDEGKRGVWVVDTDTDRCNFHKLDYPEFIVVDKPDQIKEDGNYYKLMGTRFKVDNENVISVVVPEVFKERIKAQDFDGIVNEWLDINKKDDTYLKLVVDILDEKMSLGKNICKDRLAEVKIKNFLSVGDVSYHVPSSGFTLVSGDSDSFSSNGSGKSSIIGESICWALFGETTKGLTGDDVIRRGMGDCEVYVKLFNTMQCMQTTITRSRKDGLIIHIDSTNVVEGMRQPERQAYLENNILGFDKNVFLASVYFSQENLLMLAKLSDTEKTNMITDLLGFEQYDDLQEKVLQKIHKFEEKIKQNEKDKIEFERDFAVGKEKISNFDRDISDNDKQIKEFSDIIKSYTEKVEDLRTRTVKDESFKKVDYDSQIIALTDTQDVLSNKVDAVRESIDSIQQEHNDISVKVTTFRIDVDNIKNEIKKIDKDISRLKLGEVGVRCDKCGATITKKNISTFIEEKEVSKLKLESNLTDAEVGLKVHETMWATVLTRKEQLNVKECVFASEQLGIKNQISELNRLKIDQDNKEKDLLLSKERTKSEIEKYTYYITDYSKRMSICEKDNSVLKSERSGVVCDTRLTEANIGNLETMIKDSHTAIEKLEFWKIAFSPKGIRSVLLDRFCNEINATINGYLSTVSSGTMSIMITPTKTIKSGEERNKIGMYIQLNGNEVKYEALSGGEKRRVDVSLCFGLNKFVSDKYEVPNGILGLVILDEVFSFLDKSGEESVAELLYNEGKNRSVFVIDHALNLSSYSDRIWVVKKENDVSSLEMVKQ